MASLKLLLFGRPVVELDGLPVIFETRKALAILIYLALSPQPVSREHLASLFWPVYSQKRTQSNLRRNLSSLAGSLNGKVLEINRQTVRFKDQDKIFTDVQDFRHKLKDIQSHTHDQLETCEKCLDTLEEGIRVYQGEFLEGFNLHDCPDFDDWSCQQRQALQQELRQALDSHIQQCVARRNWEKGILSAQRLVALDCLDEASHRKLMWLYAQDNQRKAALHQYEECLQILHKELDQTPEPETIELFQNIRDGNPIQFEEMQKLLTSAPEKKPVEPLPLPVQQRDQLIDTVLHTKLFIPPVRKDAVNRPRLIEQINKGVQGALTLVSAPAGFGKTTLLANWVAQSPYPVGWVSLDGDDNDRIRFIKYLVMGLKSIQSGIGDSVLDMLESLHPIPTQTILTVLINELSSITTPFALVLDDYHVIKDASIREAVVFLLDHLPPNLHLIIATRSDPLLPLARLRGQNQLMNIRGEDLRFTMDEVAEFLNRVMGLSLSDQDITRLEERTEGWIVGLQMAALSMQGKTDRAQFILSFSGSHQFILEYLTDEVLVSQPENIQEFLLLTSVLDRFCSSLCDDVINGIAAVQPEAGVVHAIGAVASQNIIEYLERSNMFLSSLDDERYWYRYHHLFAELLQARLRQAHPDWLPVLHLCAAEWCQQHQLVFEAIQHYLEAKEYERATILMEENIRSLGILRSEITTYLRWIHSLPVECIASRPWLQINHAWVHLLTGQTQDVDSLLQQVEQNIHPEFPSFETHDQIGNIALIRAYMAFFKGDLAGAIQQASVAIQQVEKENINLYSLVSILLGQAYLILGELNASQHHLREAIRTFNEIGDISGVAVAYRRMAQLFRYQGRLAAAGEISEELLHRIESRFGQRSPEVGLAQIGLGYHAYECNQLEEAESFFNSAVMNTNLLRQPSEEISAYGGLAWVFLARRDFEHARSVIEQGEYVIAKYTIPPIVQDALEATKVRFWLAMGDLPTAKNWVKERRLSIDDDLNFSQEILYLALARVLVADQQPDQALALLDRLAQAAWGAGRNGSLIEIQVQQALAAYMLGKYDVALEYLEKSLLLAESEGFRRVFLDEGTPIATMLKVLHQKHPTFCAKYVSQLILAFPLDSKMATEINPPASLAEMALIKPVDQFGKAGFLEPLTERELEVLRLLCDGCSNHQIAGKLFITVSTVKSHVHHIFSKIGVESRTQLLVRAKELNLV